jgi:hypothetical protein
MGRRTLFVVFASENDAIEARTALERCGIDPSSIAMSVDYSADGISAEAPGQAYQRQGSAVGAGLKAAVESGLRSLEDTDTREAKLIEAIESGSVALTIGPLSDRELERVQDVLSERPVVFAGC